MKFAKEDEKWTLGNWFARIWAFESWICNNNNNKILKVWISDNNNNKVLKVWINNNNNKILRV